MAHLGRREKSIHISSRIPESLYNKLENYRGDNSRSLIIVEALLQYFERLENDINPERATSLTNAELISKILEETEGIKKRLEALEAEK